VDLAFRYDSAVMVERFVAGRELSIGLLGAEALPIIEIVPAHEVYDYECKYTPGMADEHVADLPPAVAADVARQAGLAYEALGLAGCARVDFRLDAEGRAWCLEANTLPGMTELSLVPQGAAAAGLLFPALCARIVELAAAGPIPAAPPLAGAGRPAYRGLRPRRRGPRRGLVVAEPPSPLGVFLGSPSARPRAARAADVALRLALRPTRRLERRPWRERRASRARCSRCSRSTWACSSSSRRCSATCPTTWASAACAGLLEGEWWTLVTYMFVHAGLMHLAFNMFTLWMFGPRLERAWGTRAFTWFYLWCGLGGAAAHALFVRGAPGMPVPGSVGRAARSSACSSRSRCAGRTRRCCSSAWCR
jgi:hypothetical protein